MRLFSLLLMSFGFVVGVLGADALPEPGLSIVRIDRSAVRISFRAEGDWKLEWSPNLRDWHPCMSGKAGDRTLTLPIVYEQAFFRLDLGSPKSICDRDEDDDKDHGNGNHKKKDKKKKK